MLLSTKLKELRNKLGWKQVTLAQKASVPQATISRIESGRITQPKMGQLQKIAAALGVSIDYLVGESAQMSFDDLKNDKQAQILFRGWGKISAAQKEQLAQLVCFFEQQESKGEESSQS